VFSCEWTCTGSVNERETEPSDYRNLAVHFLTVYSELFHTYLTNPVAYVTTHTQPPPSCESLLGG